MVLSHQSSPPLMPLARASLPRFFIAFMMELGAPSSAASLLSVTLKTCAFTPTSHLWMRLENVVRIRTIMR